MDRGKIDALLQAIGSNADMSIKAARKLREALGDDLPFTLLEKYRKSTKWQERAWCVYLSIPYAQTSQDAFTLGINALADSSRMVRYRACMLLACSLRDDALAALRAALAHKDSKTVLDAAAAIDAIVSRNPNYFVDRNHSDKITLSVPDPYKTSP